MGKLLTEKKAADYACSVEAALDVIGGKWKGSILWHMKDGPIRFNDLARQLGGASKKMISQRLKEMEDLGLVQRELLSERPITVKYSITKFGKTALGILEDLKNWSEKNKL